MQPTILVPGSSANITPLHRVILYLDVGAVDTRDETCEQPEYYAATDLSCPIAAGADCSGRLAS